MKKYLTLVIGILMIISLTACFGGKDYKEYAGYAFDGQDPWGNPLSINLQEFKDDKFTWTYNVVIGEGENAETFSNKQVNEIKDDVINFEVIGVAYEDLDYSYEYTGTITLKDNKLIVKYKTGSISQMNPNGGSSSYQIGALDESQREVILTKTEAK